MIKNRYKSIIIVALAIVIGLFVFRLITANNKNGSVKTIIENPVIGNVVLTVATTGVVEPQNRLEIKPSIGGRIESVLVKEGDPVKTGDILVWMSSTERAALIDAARAQGEEALKYWEEVYKKTPIVSPIDGEVIVRAVEPGQTITTQDAVLVLSNRLVVSAQFDETDIAKVKLGQKSTISLDAYPDVEIEGIVGHIAYESEIVNNVTIYDVDIIPKEIPEILRSGMSVTVSVIEDEKDNVLTISSSAIRYDKDRQFVMVSNSIGKVLERDVKVGLNNDKLAEIISGLDTTDNIVVQGDSSLPKKKSAGSNPFMPSRRRS